MSLALIIPDRKLENLIERLQQLLPGVDIEVWPDIKAPDEVTFAVVWKQPAGSLMPFTQLKAIQCFGAGVDAILCDPQLPAVPIARIVDPDLTQTMVRYMDGILSYYRLRLDQFSAQQPLAQWKPKSPRKLDSVCVLGLGELGGTVARHFANAGYQVHGWSRTQKQLTGVACHSGAEGLITAVAQADIVICLLPLTGDTENLLNEEFFNKVKPGAILVNAARGAIVDDNALLNALDNGQLQAACLDVFRLEPLPTEHPFWQHRSILITPHVSAVTNVATATAQIAENYKRSLIAQPLLNLVDVVRGY